MSNSQLSGSTKEVTVRKLMSIALFLLLGCVGAAKAQSCPGAAGWVFDDVPASDPFCPQITWLAQRGISLGCGVIDGAHRLVLSGSKRPTEPNGRLPEPSR